MKSFQVSPSFCDKEFTIALSMQKREVHLLNISDKLAVYKSRGVRRSVRWARYHVQMTVSDIRESRIRDGKHHLKRAVEHLNTALKALLEWDKKLPEDERRYIPSL